MQPQPVTAAEIAALLRDIRALSGNPTAAPAQRAEVLARKAELLARIAANDATGPVDQIQHRDDPAVFYGEEPLVDVRAGLLGDAIGLLELCDQLINHPGHARIDARLHQLGGPPRCTVTGIRCPHDALAATAHELQSILDDAGIIVEPTLPGRTRRRHPA